MTTAFRTGSVLILWLALAMVEPRPAIAQWFLALDVGSERYWGASVDNSPDRLSFRPYRPTILGAGLERRFGSLGAALRFRYMDAGMALEGQEAAALVNGVFTVISASPEINYRVLRLGPEKELFLHAGPLVEYWDLIDQDSRIRLGAQAAFSLRIPLGGRIAMSLAAYGAVIGSPFEDSELPDTYELRTLWRRGLSGGIRYRL